MKRFLVIGLGTFGSQAARALYRHGAEVLAVDLDESKVEAVSDRSTRAVCLNALDEEAMESIGAFDVDVAILALRHRFDSTVLVTYNLKQHEIREILVQVDSEKEAEAILAIGATGVIFPERDMADAIVRRMMAPTLADQIPLGDDVGIIEVPCRGDYDGKTLIELDIRKHYQVTVIAIKKSLSKEERQAVEVAPSPDTPLSESDILMVVGKADKLEKFKQAMTADK